MTAQLDVLDSNGFSHNGHHKLMSESTQSCSKCKKATSRQETTSIHNTLAYSRCRCHRSFRYKNREPFMPSVSASHGMPESISILAPKLTLRPKRSVTCRSTSSQVFPSTTNHSSITTHSGSWSRETTVVDSPFTLPLINTNQQSLVALSESDNGQNGGNISSASVTLASIRTTPNTNPQLLPESSATLVKSFPPRLPQPSRENEATLYLKQRKSVVDVSQLLYIVQFIPQRKRHELRLSFKYLDTDGDGHLSLVEFMSGLPGTLKSSDTEFLKHLHGRLGCETYFGAKEFTLVYCIAESLAKWSSRLKQDYHVKENFVNVLASFITNLVKKSDEDGFVSTTAVIEAVQEVKAGSHQILKVIPSTLAKVATEGQLHLLQCVSLSPYFLYLTHI